MRIECCFWEINGENEAWPKEKQSKVASSLPPLVRRRLTSLGQKALGMFYRTFPSENQKKIPWVVACRHGDMQRMVNLLSSLAAKEVFSPTDFSMSVHNAIVGLYSICVKNEEPHTALSGGELSFEAGLLEAFALQKEKRKTVGYIYYDSPLPGQYEGKIENDCPDICIALLLK
jgi:hypothetical protein